MRLYGKLICFSVFASPVYGISINPGTSAADRFIDERFFRGADLESVVEIQVSKPSGVKKGAGVLIAGRGDSLFVLTAAHIFDDPKPSPVFGANAQDQDISSYTINALPVGPSELMGPNAFLPASDTINDNASLTTGGGIDGVIPHPFFTKGFLYYHLLHLRRLLACFPDMTLR